MFIMFMTFIKLIIFIMLTKKRYKKVEMWISVGGGRGQSMWIILKFYNIIIKSAHVNRGGGKAYPQNVD